MTNGLASGLRRFWWVVTAAFAGVCAMRPIESVLPADAVLFPDVGAVYRLRAPRAPGTVTVVHDVRALQKTREQPGDSVPPSPGSVPGAAFEVASGAAARVVGALEDDRRRPVFKVRVLEGPQAGNKGHVYRSVLGRDAPRRLGPLTPARALAASLAIGLAALLRAAAIVVKERP